MTDLTSGAAGRDEPLDVSLRPTGFSEFVGQAPARANLEVFIAAAKQRKAALDHVLFVGPPGLGKTTLAQIVARELGVGFRATSGPVIAKAGDLAALLTNLDQHDVLFIDEIHRLNPAIEEILYPAMEDYQLDLIIGEGPAARSVRIDLAKFTLIGATTRAGLLTTPLRDRFGIPVRLNFYTAEELVQIVERGARLLGVGMAADGALEIARRSRGTPRIAGRLVRRVTDFALVDFGPATASGTYVGNHPLVYGIDRPQIGETVCRSGATTGEHCGTVRSRRGVMQYLTEPGMTPCAGGDSGGAVWINRNGGAQIIGVWLGGVTTADGADLGRFAVLADGFDALGLV